MRLSLKITMILLMGFLLIISLTTLTMGMVLWKQYEHNITIYKKEFTQFQHDEINHSSTIFFEMLQNELEKEDAADVDMVIRELMTRELTQQHIMVFNADGELMKSYGMTADVRAVATEQRVKNAIHQSLLELRRTFSISNEDLFNSDSEVDRRLILMNFHTYEQDGIVVGFGRTYTLTRLEFIEEQNSQMAITSLLFTTGSIAIIATIVMLITWWLISRMVINPIQRMGDVCDLFASGAYGSRVSVNSKDEIGRLAGSFNTMAQRLEVTLEEVEESRKDLAGRVDERTRDLSKANEELREQILQNEQMQHERDAIHQELIDTARQAGMAEVATNVLHNVGNALNSVLVASSRLRLRNNQSSHQDVERLAQLLERHEADMISFIEHTPQGQELTSFMRALANRLNDEARESSDELEVLSHYTNHIKSVIVWQQSYAKSKGFQEKVRISKLLDDSVLVVKNALERRGIELDVDLPHNMEANVDRHGVIQILVNLLSNARDALQDVSIARPKILIKVQQISDDRIEFVIADNGRGITPLEMDRIFEHGFTTKANGHGFGLHGASIAARSMGGELKAQSDGVGQGARFILQLPKSVIHPDGETFDGQSDIR